MYISKQKASHSSFKGALVQLREPCKFNLPGRARWSRRRWTQSWDRQLFSKLSARSSVSPGPFLKRMAPKHRAWAPWCPPGSRSSVWCASLCSAFAPPGNWQTQERVPAKAAAQLCVCLTAGLALRLLMNSMQKVITESQTVICLLYKLKPTCKEEKSKEMPGKQRTKAFHSFSLLRATFLNHLKDKYYPTISFDFFRFFFPSLPCTVLFLIPWKLWLLLGVFFLCIKMQCFIQLLK